jgi:hypothetical protein
MPPAVLGRDLAVLNRDAQIARRVVPVRDTHHDVIGGFANELETTDQRSSR